jgi:hypothetical protein
MLNRTFLELMTEIRRECTETSTANHNGALIADEKIWTLLCTFPKCFSFWIPFPCDSETLNQLGLSEGSMRCIEGWDGFDRMTAITMERGDHTDAE